MTTDTCLCDISQQSIQRDVGIRSTWSHLIKGKSEGRLKLFLLPHFWGYLSILAKMSCKADVSALHVRFEGRETPLSLGFVRVSNNKSSKPQKRSPPHHAVSADVSSGTQVWSHYYASLPSVRNTMILLKVLDSLCAPFSWLNYVQLSSSGAPRCCTSCVLCRSRTFCSCFQPQWLSHTAHDSEPIQPLIQVCLLQKTFLFAWYDLEEMYLLQQPHSFQSKTSESMEVTWRTLWEAAGSPGFAPSVPDVIIV